MHKIIVFDVWADYAHFKKYYTTTSPLTFSFPPRTTITGLIGAIIGLDKTEYIQYFTKEEAKIALRILNPIKKTRVAMNLINTKFSMNIIHSRTQIRLELLKDAKFRIFFQHSNNDIYQRVLEFLRAHKSVYTPCLGLSEHIANFKFQGEVTCEEKHSSDYISIDSVISTPNGQELPIDFEKGFEYFQETIPIVMDSSREVTEYSMVTIERNGRPIRARVGTYWELGTNERISFF